MSHREVCSTLGTVLFRKGSGAWAVAANSALSLPLRGAQEHPLTPPQTFPSVSSVELIYPKDTQLGRKTSPPVFQVTAGPAAEGEGMKLGTDGAGGRGVQRAGDGVRAGWRGLLGCFWAPATVRAPL